MSSLRKLVTATSAAILMAAATTTIASASDDDYPSQPINVLLGFSAGGALDTMVRLLVDDLSAELGQPVVVENKPGAGGYIAWREVAASEPDGYTVTISGNVIGMAKALRPDEPLDPREAFVPVGRIATAPMALMIHGGLEPDTLEEFIAFAKEKSDGITIASSGVGSVSHMSTEALMIALGLDTVHIPYRGGGESNAAIVGGHVDSMVTNFGAAARAAEEGGVKVLVVTAPERIDRLPDVPTLAELGIDPKIHLGFWWGFFVPADTPEPIRAKLESSLQAVLEKPDVIKRLADVQVEAAFAPGDEMSSILNDEIEKWRAFAEERGIRPE